MDTENNEMQTTASTRRAARGAKWKSRRKQSARKKTKVRETAPVDQPLGLNYPPDHIDQNRVSFLQQILNPAIQSALRSVCSHDACASQLARYRNLTRQWEEEPLERFATAEELASLRAFTGKNPQQLQRRYQRLWMARGEEAERAALPARERRIEKLVHWSAGLAACDGCVLAVNTTAFPLWRSDKPLLRRFVGSEEKEAFVALRDVSGGDNSGGDASGGDKSGGGVNEDESGDDKADTFSITGIIVTT